ncbi:MAG: hypothetical protein DI640_13120 [Sphingomonas taxi]|uniref:Uncharacterized protein n=1 Tax=Sphingomonas taxi TaxID=1549858 RepID=A0A2W4YXS3_9SPHN|nr:MAG: hypothetical protein DI640_13120 [Sphingomonas taxi]
MVPLEQLLADLEDDVCHILVNAQFMSETPSVVTALRKSYPSPLAYTGLASWVGTILCTPNRFGRSRPLGHYHRIIDDRNADETRDAINRGIARAAALDIRA